MSAHGCDERTGDAGGPERRIEVAGWGLFFVWVGIAVFLDVGWGFGLIGVGLIMLLGQAARRYVGAKTEAFSIVCGFFLVLGGLSMISGVQLRLTPLVCMVAGFALLVSVVVGRVRG
jgi:hypothetical protein